MNAGKNYLHNFSLLDVLTRQDIDENDEMQCAARKRDEYKIRVRTIRGTDRVSRK